MIDHLSLPISKILPALKFYKAVFAPLHIVCVGISDVWIGFGERANSENPHRIYLSLLKSEAYLPDKCHIAFKAKSRAIVTQAYLNGLRNGGRDDGAPNLRPEYHESYFAGFLRDPDGNRIEIVCHV